MFDADAADLIVSLGSRIAGSVLLPGIGMRHGSNHQVPGGTVWQVAGTPVINWSHNAHNGTGR